MLLLKIPWIIAATIALQVWFTPPSPILPQEKPVGVKERRSKYHHAGLAMITMAWIFGAAEVAAILVGRWSSLEHWLPSNFKVGDTSKIYLSLTSAQGAFFIIGGSFLRWKCNETFRGWLTSKSSPLKEKYILTSGPYSIVRHPTYTAAIMVYLGMFFWFGSRGSWVRESGMLATILGKAIAGTMSTLMLGAIVFGLIRMHDEDNLLRREFGEEWMPWVESVPNRLIPGVY